MPCPQAHVYHFATTALIHVPLLYCSGFCHCPCNLGTVHPSVLLVPLLPRACFATLIPPPNLYSLKVEQLLEDLSKHSSACPATPTFPQLSVILLCFLLFFQGWRQKLRGIIFYFPSRQKNFMVTPLFLKK